MRSPWGSDWTVGVRAAIERRGRTVLDDDSADLLAAVGSLKSITAAAKAIGISYRHAWTIVQTVNETAGECLVECAVGGVKGGGAQLTERGQIAVRTYEQLRAVLLPAAAGVLQRLVTSPDSTAPIHLAAAISLQDAIGQLLTDFVLVQPGARVRAVYGASNELADHLLAGAPGDLFIASDSALLDRLGSAGLLGTPSQRTLVSNTLAVIGPWGQSPNIRRSEDLARCDIKRIAVAEPACPVGNRARMFLEKTGLLHSIEPKLIYVDNARAVLTAVESGRADVGLAFVSDAATHRCQVLLRSKDPTASVKYVAAVLGKNRPSPDYARALFNFLFSDHGARVFRRCGFRVLRKKPR